MAAELLRPEPLKTDVFTVSGARRERTAISCGSKAPCLNCMRNCIPQITPTPAGSSACGY